MRHDGIAPHVTVAMHSARAYGAVVVQDFKWHVIRLRNGNGLQAITRLARVALIDALRVAVLQSVLPPQCQHFLRDLGMAGLRQRIDIAAPILFLLRLRRQRRFKVHNPIGQSLRLGLQKTQMIMRASMIGPQFQDGAVQFFGNLHLTSVVMPHGESQDFFCDFFKLLFEWFGNRGLWGSGSSHGVWETLKKTGSKLRKLGL